MLRQSNVFSAGCNNSALLKSDVKISHSHAVPRVTSIKNTRFKEVKYILPVSGIVNSLLCLIFALEKGLNFSDRIRVDEPLLSYSEREKLESLSANEFAEILKNSLRTAGFDERGFSIHSIRRGSATFAASSGVSVAAIKAQGTWTSSCYERYIDRDTALRKGFTENMAAAAFKRFHWAWFFLGFWCKLAALRRSIIYSDM